MPRTYSLEETRQVLKNTLFRAFPGIPFRVHLRPPANLDVYWIDGPNVHQVQHICNSFEGSGLDSLADIKFKSPDVTFQGQLSRFQVDIIRAFRRHTRKLLMQAASLVATECNLPLLYVDKKRRILGGDHTVPFTYVRHSQSFLFTNHEQERYSDLIQQAAAGLSLLAAAPVLLPARATSTQLQEVTR